MADGSSSGWAGQPSTRIAEIDSAKLGADGHREMLRWRNPQKLDPGNYTVVLEPTATGDLVRLMGGAFSAREHRRRPTFLSKRGGGTLLGEKLFPEFITLRTDPFDPRQPRHPWTGDLLPTRAMTWVDKGVIANLAYDRYWADENRQAADAAASRGGGGAGRWRRREPDHGRRRCDARATDRVGRARPADHAFLVHPRRESADPSAYRPDARRRCS